MGDMGALIAAQRETTTAITNMQLETTTTHGQQRIIMNSAINPYGGHSMNPGK